LIHRNQNSSDNQYTLPKKLRFYPVEVEFVVIDPWTCLSFPSNNSTWLSNL